ncbi:MAG: hypothetical protein AAFP13_10610 [Pseudomonadota bacterium]
MDLTIIFLFIIASMFGTAVMIWAVRKSGQKREDYAAYAAAQGWDYSKTEGDGTHRLVDAFCEPGDDWALRIIFVSGGAQGHATQRYVEWTTQAGALPAGEAVLGMPIPEKTARMLQSGGAMGQTVARAALKGTLYALGNTRFDLPFDTATAGHPGGVVMASPGNEASMDALRDSADLAAFRAARREADVPVIIRDTEGLRLRRPGAPRTLEELSALVALGKSLRAAL